MKFKRIFLMVLESLGVGEAKDASNYGDNGCNTLGNIKNNYDTCISYIPVYTGTWNDRRYNSSSDIYPGKSY